MICLFGFPQFYELLHPAALNSISQKANNIKDSMSLPCFHILHLFNEFVDLFAKFEKALSCRSLQRPPEASGTQNSPKLPQEPVQVSPNIALP